MLRVLPNKQGKVTVLSVNGRIVRGETETLRTAVISRLDASVIVLDLARVLTIDAGGLGLMLELREYAESRGIEFKLKNVTKLVRRILELTRLDSVLDVTYTPESAAIPSYAASGSHVRTHCCAHARA
jgi:anti-anti-sigma factor